jgi:hypothetical protein
MAYSGEMIFGKSTDRGETWDATNMSATGMYFYKILFDEENPAFLYSSGSQHSELQDTVRIYRSTDAGNSWELAHKEKSENCGGVWDMLKYKNKLILYTLNSGLFELDLDNITGNPAIDAGNASLSVYPNPAGSLLTVVHAGTADDLQMYDVTGRAVGIFPNSGNPDNRETTLDISRLNPGVYFLRAGSETVKVIKK